MTFEVISKVILLFKRLIGEKLVGKRSRFVQALIGQQVCVLHVFFQVSRFKGENITCMFF